MKINPYIFRNYDIRGLVPQDLDEVKVAAIGKAYGTFLIKRGIKRAVVGRDCRLSGESFQKVFITGLASTGVDVVDLGMVMTQMVYFAQYNYKCEGGAMITASHNPFNFNGFKLATGYSQTTEQEDVQEIRKITETEEFMVAAKPGTVIQEDVTADYEKDLMTKIQIGKKFTVVADSRYGTTGRYIPRILELAGQNVIPLNSEIDGRFPAGTPDPTDEKIMKELGQAVLAKKADLGFAFDGDGDRIGLVDEKGRILWNDVMVAIFAKEILEKQPGAKIIYNTLCSKVVKEVVEQNGGVPIIWKTGHTFIKSKIAKEGAAFGGELSGHFFFKDEAYGHDDGSYAALRILRYLAKKGMSLSELYETFPKYISSPEIKIGCPDERKKEVIKDLATKFKADFPGAEVTDDSIIPGDDGVRLDLTDGMIIFRYSQNGPYITVRFEAKEEAVYQERKKYVRETLKSYPEMIWQDQLCVNLAALE
ncbi:MAG: phosphomannomutase/phosphoglucomutase [Patescibacteria group bacterium]